MKYIFSLNRKVVIWLNSFFNAKKLSKLFLSRLCAQIIEHRYIFKWENERPII